MVANPVVRGLLDRKRSEEHLQSSNESITKHKNKKKGTITQSTCQKKIEEGHSIERGFGIVPAASHPIPSSDRNHAPKRIASTTTPCSQGFRFLYRHSRRRSGSPWVGPINAALKRFKLASAVTPGATSTSSASSASLFLCRCSDAFSSSYTHAALNLQRAMLEVLIL